MQQLDDPTLPPPRPYPLSHAQLMATYQAAVDRDDDFTPAARTRLAALKSLASARGPVNEL